MLSYFKEDGLLAESMSNYETRPEQVKMALVVEQTLRLGGVALIEAGTGTGKSLAYLAPAATLSKELDKPIVISTNTINLQEQLIRKDIPLIKQTLFPQLETVLVKGWSNYLCLKRYEEFMQSSQSLDSRLNQEVAAIKIWVSDNIYEGSKSELPFIPATDIWNEICAEGDICPRKACPYYEKCFVILARKKMEQAHLLVVNHHILLADVSVRQETDWEIESAVLPDYNHVIIDEAHHLEEVATDHFGYHFSRLGWQQFMGRLYRRRKEEGGFLIRLYNLLIQKGQDKSADLIKVNVLPALLYADQNSQAFFNSIDSWVKENGLDTYEEIVYPDEDWDERIGSVAEEFTKALAKVGEMLKKIHQGLSEVSEDFNMELHETHAMMNRTYRLLNHVKALAKADEESYVFWLEHEGRTNEYSLWSSPMNVGPFINEWTKHLDSFICSSATLALAGNFQYFKMRTGLDHITETPVIEEAISSPFNYPSQVRIFVPTNLPDPNDSQYVQQMSESLLQLLKRTKGRAFVLFTSYSSLMATAELLTDHLKELEIPLWIQGDLPRNQLIEGYRNHEGSVLFGTDSFWEGVDVPGAALSVVVLARLPFEVPTNPLTKARLDWLRQNGENPFYSYTLPKAALKLKQGFGRLIRSKSDRGAVIIYDNRILTKSYGRILRSVLPDAPWIVTDSLELPEQVEKWLF